MACEQQCRGLALQLINRSWEGLRRGVLAARLGALYIGNPRSEICSDVPKICYLPSMRIATTALARWRQRRHPPLCALALDREPLGFERRGCFGRKKELEEFVRLGLGGGGERHGI